MESIQERIEHRAYDLYLKRCKIPGFHEEDWAQAEKEIAAEIEAGKKTEAERTRITAAKAAPAPVVKESSPASAPLKAAAPVQPSPSGKAAESASPKSPAPAAVKLPAKTSRKKK